MIVYLGLEAISVKIITTSAMDDVGGGGGTIHSSLNSADGDNSQLKRSHR